MSFKNAVKILIAKFGLVWIVLLYLVIFSAIIASLSITFVIPVVRAFQAAGIGGQFTALFNSIMNGDTVSGWFTVIKEIVDNVGNVLKTDFSAMLNSTLFLVLVLTLASRFLVGLYELPLVAVLEGAMSSNARIGFMGRFISKLGVSCRFVLAKMLYTILYDGVFYTVIYFMFGLFDVKGLALFAPFIIMFAFILLIAARYTVISMWAPSVVVGGKKIFPGLFASVKKTFRNFGAVYSTFVISWTIIIALNVLVGLFTFGAGLLITIPVSMVFINILNMTVYYGKNGKRYYADSTIVTPPAAGAEEQS